MNKRLHVLCWALALAAPGIAAAQTDPPAPNALPAAPVPPPAPSVPAAPVPPAVPTAPVAPVAPIAPSANDTYLLGRTYHIETVAGAAFTGKLVAKSLTGLEFEAQELGHISLQGIQVRHADLQEAAKAGTRPDYYDIGNGNRLFLAPTGRCLRKGENTLQDVSFYLVGGDFGITQTFSIGGYMSLLPGLGISNQFFMLTPKISFPVTEKLHVGAGALYLRIPTFDVLDRAYGAGILYGAATYGSADNNVTAGLGYGFFESEIGKTPILQVGGQTRVSRRISLISESYIIADSRAGLGGLYGIKINWRRTSLGLGAAYYYIFGRDETETYTNYINGQYVTSTRTYHQNGMGGSSYVLPVYYDFAFRFGRAVK